MEPIKNSKLRINSMGSEQIKSLRVHSLSKISLQKRRQQNSLSLRNLKSKKRLTPLKQYETKLVLSCESWVIFDMKKKCYKRGWKPSSQGQFNGLIKLIILKAYIQCLRYNSKVEDTQVRLNIAYLKDEIKKRMRENSRKKKLLLNLEEKNPRFFQAGTVIQFQHLLYGLLMTPYEDIFEHAVIFMGYIAHCIDLDIEKAGETLQIEQVKKANTYEQYFYQYCNKKFLQHIDLVDSFFDEKQNFISTPNDICKLYLCLLNEPLFRDIVGRSKYAFSFKFQVGFKFWETRYAKFYNKRMQLGEDYYLTLNEKGRRNFSVICHNSKLKTLIILEDCKFGMAGRDIPVIQNWFIDVTKPIVQKRKQALKANYLLKMSENDENPLTLNERARKLTRIETIL